MQDLEGGEPAIAFRNLVLQPFFVMDDFIECQLYAVQR